MDLDEWELLSDDAFLDQLQAQDGGGGAGSKRENLSLHPTNSLVDMDYFQKFIDPPDLLIPVPQLSKSDDLVVKEVVSPQNDAVSSQVFFKKIRENEFADMKLDSPKSLNMGVFPQIDLGNPQFEEEDKEEEEDEEEVFGDFTEEKVKVVDSVEQVFDCKEEKLSENSNDHGGLNIWKMGMTGIGALCSFGFACATICVIAMNCRHGHKHHEQKLHFQIYADDKRMKEVVHHAAKLNEAISAVRGAPLSRAHITIGGYFEGL